MEYENMTQDDAIAYCQRHFTEYVSGIEGDGVRMFHCLIELLEDGLNPTELPDYGMDYEEKIK